MIYFDNAANAPISKKALDAFVKISLMTGNPNSAHTEGRHNAKLLEMAKLSIARSLNCDPSQVIFTSGATEAVNLANASMASQGNLYVDLSGHKCDTVFNQKADGKSNDTVCLSHILASNETGEIFDIGNLRSGYSLIAADATAAVGHIPIDFERLDLDYLSFGGHKFGAPVGIGALIKKESAPIRPIIIGGGNSQNGWRAGTEPVALAISMAYALEEKMENINLKAHSICEMRDYLVQEISRIDGAHINGNIRRGDYTNHLPNIVNFRIDGITGDSLVAIMCEKYEVMISSGAACSTGESEPSKALLAYGLTRQEALESVRVSLSSENTMYQCVKFIEYLREIVKIIRR